MKLSFVESTTGDGGVLYVADLVLTVIARNADEGRYEVLVEGSTDDDAPEAIHVAFSTPINDETWDVVV